MIEGFSKKRERENWIMSEKLTEIFGIDVFNETKMRERLPKTAFTALKQVIEKGGDLPLDTANVIANAMKDWAIENGATHYTHWFQPLTGITAEKHLPVIRRLAPHPYNKVYAAFAIVLELNEHGHLFCIYYHFIF